MLFYVKKWTVTVRTFFFFLKNDGWEPAARFITYEFEQLVRLLRFFCCSWMEIAFNKTVASVRGNSSLVFPPFGGKKKRFGATKWASKHNRLKSSNNYNPGSG